MAEITAKIFRFDPSTDRAPRYETYKVPAEESMTILEILRYIRRNLDRTLSFRDYICYKGICANCLVSVDGKPLRGCSTRVNPGETITVEPVFEHPIVKDLVVDFGFYAQGEEVGYLIKKGALIKKLQSP
ncbi:TPA: ferredoxin [Candidatus Bathyarchaeota archaeon]|nr:ferredoxin [Candidatus Bathyarchaeota archaeon]